MGQLGPGGDVLKVAADQRARLLWVGVGHAANNGGQTAEFYIGHEVSNVSFDLDICLSAGRIFSSARPESVLGR